MQNGIFLRAGAGAGAHWCGAAVKDMGSRSKRHLVPCMSGRGTAAHESMYRCRDGTGLAGDALRVTRVPRADGVLVLGCNTVDATHMGSR